MQLQKPLNVGAYHYFHNFPYAQVKTAVGRNEATSSGELPVFKMGRIFPVFEASGTKPKRSANGLARQFCHFGSLLVGISGLQTPAFGKLKFEPPLGEHVILNFKKKTGKVAPALRTKIKPWQCAVQTYFPRAVPTQRFAARSELALSEFGFPFLCVTLSR